jgi:kynurenine 3-monooxygenase
VATTKKPTISIIGAGLTGCFLALLLAQRGYTIHIYERMAKEEIADTSSKRSFNLTFYHYGMLALKEIGLWEKIVPHLIRLKGSVTQISKDSKPIFARFDYNNMPYFAIQRAKLLDVLIKEALSNPAITLHFDTSLVSIERYEKTMLLQNTNDNKIKTVSFDVVLGADGANSLTRSFLQQGQLTNHLQEYTDYEYKQILISKAMAEKIELLEDTQHAWTRKHETLIAFPNGDGSFTGMLILPKNNQQGFASLTSLEKINNFFATLFPNFLPVIDDIFDQIKVNPLGYFVTVYTNPWYYKDSIAIFGDAAHACLPFYGVGMSVAFGDCMEFVALLDKYDGDWKKTFHQYQIERKKHTDIIANLAKESFVRFRRYKKGDPVAIYDRIEALMHTIAPKVFKPPLFNQVANDPNHAADFYQAQAAQKKRAKLLGIPALIMFTAGLIELNETIKKSLKESKH